jgi:hypothetical protein
MDDFSLSNLQESRNEWCSRLITVLTPCIIDGVKSIFEESWKLCVENDEKTKYLMTFQNFLSRVPKWNPNIISNECSRIKEKSNCSYITDLITCVHVIQLKMLSCMRVGTKQKKIDVSIPSLDEFVHHVYINVARKIYTNVYLFEMGISSLKSQKNARELEIIIKECILQTIRETIPVEELLKLYMSETVENAIEVHEKEEIISQQPIIEKPIAGNISEPSQVSIKEKKEEEETLSKIKAASSAASNSLSSNINIVDESSSSSSSSGVSFNMNNNQVIEIENNNTNSEKQNKSSNDYDDFDDHDHDDDEDEDDENVKLNIGDSVEISVDAFPSDDEDGNENSNIDLNIEEIPIIEDF